MSSKSASEQRNKRTVLNKVETGNKRKNRSVLVKEQLPVPVRQKKISFSDNVSQYGCEARHNRPDDRDLYKEHNSRQDWTRNSTLKQFLPAGWRNGVEGYHDHRLEEEYRYPRDTGVRHDYGQSKNTRGMPSQSSHFVQHTDKPSRREYRIHQSGDHVMDCRTLGRENQGNARSYCGEDNRNICDSSNMERGGNHLSSRRYPAVVSCDNPSRYPPRQIPPKKPNSSNYHPYIRHLDDVNESIDDNLPASCLTDLMVHEKTSYVTPTLSKTSYITPTLSKASYVTPTVSKTSYITPTLSKSPPFTSNKLSISPQKTKHHHYPQVSQNLHKSSKNFTCYQKPFTEYSGFFNQGRNGGFNRVKMIKNDAIEVVEILPDDDTHIPIFPQVKTKTASKSKKLFEKKESNDFDCLIVDLKSETLSQKNPEKNRSEIFESLDTNQVIVVSRSSDSDGDIKLKSIVRNANYSNSSVLRDWKSPFTKYTNTPSEFGFVFNKPKFKPMKRLRRDLPVGHKVKKQVDISRLPPIDENLPCPLPGEKQVRSCDVLSPSQPANDLQSRTPNLSGPTIINNSQSTSSKKSRKKITSSHVSKYHPSLTVVDSKKSLVTKVSNSPRKIQDSFQTNIPKTQIDSQNNTYKTLHLSKKNTKVIQESTELGRCDDPNRESSNDDSINCVENFLSQNQTVSPHKSLSVPSISQVKTGNRNLKTDSDERSPNNHIHPKNTPIPTKNKKYSKRAKLKLNKKTRKMSERSLVDTTSESETCNSSHREMRAKDFVESEETLTGATDPDTSSEKIITDSSSDIKECEELNRSPNYFQYLDTTSPPWSPKHTSVKIFNKQVNKKKLVDKMRSGSSVAKTSLTIPYLDDVLNDSWHDYPPRNLLNPLITPIVVLKPTGMRKFTYRMPSITRRLQEEKRHLKKIEKWKNGFGVMDGDDDDVDDILYQLPLSDPIFEVDSGRESSSERKSPMEKVWQHEKEQDNAMKAFPKESEHHQNESCNQKDLLENRRVDRPAELLDMPVICQDPLPEVNHTKENFSIQNKNPSQNKNSVSCQNKKPELPLVTKHCLPVPEKHKPGPKKKRSRKTSQVPEELQTINTTKRYPAISPRRSKDAPSENLTAVHHEVHDFADAANVAVKNSKSSKNTKSYNGIGTQPNTSTPKFFHSFHHLMEPELSGISEEDEGNRNHAQTSGPVSESFKQSGQSNCRKSNRKEEDKLSVRSEEKSEDQPHLPRYLTEDGVQGKSKKVTQMFHKVPKSRRSDSKYDETLTSEDDFSVIPTASNANLSLRSFSSIASIFNKPSQDTVKKAADSTSDILYRKNEARKPQNINSMVQDYLEKLVKHPVSYLKDVNTQDNIIQDKDFISCDDISVQEYAKDFFELSGADVLPQQDEACTDQISELTQDNINMLVEISSLWGEIHNEGNRQKTDVNENLGFSTTAESLFGDLSSSTGKESGVVEPLKDSPDSPDMVPEPQDDPHVGAGFRVLEEDLRINSSSSSDNQDSFISETKQMEEAGRWGEGGRLEEMTPTVIQDEDMEPPSQADEKTKLKQSTELNKDEETEFNLNEMKDFSKLESHEENSHENCEVEGYSLTNRDIEKETLLTRKHDSELSECDSENFKRLNSLEWQERFRRQDKVLGRPVKYVEPTDEIPSHSQQLQDSQSQDGVNSVGEPGRRDIQDGGGNQHNPIRTRENNEPLIIKISNKKVTGQEDELSTNKSPRRRRLKRHRLAECVPAESSGQEKMNLMESSKIRDQLSSTSVVSVFSADKNSPKDSFQLREDSCKNFHSITTPPINSSSGLVDSVLSNNVTNSKSISNNSTNDVTNTKSSLENSTNEKSVIKSDHVIHNKQVVEGTTCDDAEIHESKLQDLSEDSVKDKSPVPSLEAGVSSPVWKQIFHDKAVVMVEPLKKKIKCEGSVYKKKADVWRMRSKVKNLFTCPDSTKPSDEILRFIETIREDVSRPEQKMDLNIESAEESTNPIIRGEDLTKFDKTITLSKKETSKKIKWVQISEYGPEDMEEPKIDPSSSTKQRLEHITKHPAMKTPVSKLAQNILKRKALEDKAAKMKKENVFEPLESFEEIIRKTKNPAPKTSPYPAENSGSNMQDKDASFTIPKLRKDFKIPPVSRLDQKDDFLVSPLTRRYIDNDSIPTLEFSTSKSSGFLPPNRPSGFVFGETRLSFSPFGKRKTFEDSRESSGFLSPRCPGQSAFVFGETKLSASPFGKRKSLEDRKKGFFFGKSSLSNSDQLIKKDLLKKLESVLPMETEKKSDDDPGFTFTKLNRPPSTPESVFSGNLSPASSSSSTSSSIRKRSSSSLPLLLRSQDRTVSLSRKENLMSPKKGDSTPHKKLFNRQSSVVQPADIPNTFVFEPMESRGAGPSDSCENTKEILPSDLKNNGSESLLDGGEEELIYEDSLLGESDENKLERVEDDAEEQKVDPHASNGKAFDAMETSTQSLELKEKQLTAPPSKNLNILRKTSDDPKASEESAILNDKVESDSTKGIHGQKSWEQFASNCFQEDERKENSKSIQKSKSDSIVDISKSDTTVDISKGLDTEKSSQSNHPEYELEEKILTEECDESQMEYSYITLDRWGGKYAESIIVEEADPEHGVSSPEAGDSQSSLKYRETRSEANDLNTSPRERSDHEYLCGLQDSSDISPDRLKSKKTASMVEKVTEKDEEVKSEDGDSDGDKKESLVDDDVDDDDDDDDKPVDDDDDKSVDDDDDKYLDDDDDKSVDDEDDKYMDDDDEGKSVDDDDDDKSVDIDDEDKAVDDDDDDKAVDDDDDKAVDDDDDDDKAVDDEDDVLSLLPSDDEFLDEYEVEKVRPLKKKAAPVIEEVEEKVSKDSFGNSTGRACPGGESSGPKVRVDVVSEAKTINIRKWLVPLNYCFDFVLSNNCKRKECNYIHAIPKPEAICNHAASQISHMLNTNRSKDAVDMYIGVQQLQLKCSLRPLDKFIKPLLEACFIIGFSYANVAYNLLCFLHSNQKELVDGRTFCEFIKLCGANRVANFMLLSNAFNMMKSLNLQPTSVDALITLLMLFYELKKYQELFEVMIYCNECEVPCVPLFVRVAALKHAIQFPELYMNYTATWIDQTHEHLLTDVDKELLVHLLLIFKNKKCNSVVQKLDWVLQIQTQATIPEIEEPDIDREEAENVAASYFESREEQINEKISYMHRIQGCKSSCNWEYLAQIYLDLCSAHWPKNSDYIDRYIDTITAHKNKILEAFRHFLTLIGTLIEKERSKNVFFEFDQKSLSCIGSGILHECCVKEIYDQGAEILNLMLAWNIKVSETRSHDIHRAVQNVLIICSHSNNPKLAVNILEDLRWLRYNMTPVSNVTLYKEHLNKLIKCLVSRVECKLAFDVLSFFVAILKRSGTNVESLDSFHDHFPEIVNRCLTFGLLQIGLSTFKLHKAICPSKKIFHQSTLRSLFAACYEINNMIDAEEIYNYTYSSFYHKYTQQNLHDSKPRRVKLSPLLCVGEMFFILREYLSNLYGYFCKMLDEGFCLVFEDLHVVIEFVCDGDANIRNLPYLSSVPLSDYSAGELLRLALASLKPPILTKIIPGTNVHELSSNHLRDYLHSIDSKERKIDLRFEPQRPRGRVY